GDSSAYMSGLGKAFKEQKLILILAAPQPRNATTIAAVVAKGMRQELAVNAAAKRSAEAYAQRVELPFSAGELSSFSVLPANAHTIENPFGIFQGYAVAGNDHLLVVLPATPQELEYCFEQNLNRLLSKFNELNSPMSKLASIADTVRNRLVPTGGSYGKAKNEMEREPSDMRKTNLLGRLRAGKVTKNDKIRLIAVSIFLAVFIGCMIYIGSVYKESADNAQLSDDLKTLFTSDAKPQRKPSEYPKGYMEKFFALYDQNTDVAGWIKIPDTKLDYVVVQSTDNAFYERRDFTKKDNQHGVPFVDYRVDQFMPSTNTVIYAHNMNDGQMFGELMNYKQLSFYKKHPVINYDSIYSEGQYKIFGIVLCKKNDPDFDYHNFIDKSSDQDMTNYVNKIRERSLINTKVDMRTDDTLLTLSTCDYSFKSNEGDRIARFVVFARKVREGESADVNVEGATLNPNPVLPAEWYNELARQQAAERKKQEEAQASSAAAAVSSKWLTASESKELSAEEQKKLAEMRQASAKKYLTYDEQEDLSLDEMLYLIDEREYEFKLYLSSDEENMSISKRLTLARDRSDLAHEWLTPDEIRSAGRWSRINALIKERQAAGTPTPPPTATPTPTPGTGEADKYIKDNPKWLNSDDKGLSLSELKALVAERKDMASAAGIDTGKYSSWSAMSKAIDAANAAKRDKLYNDNRTWLDSGDAGLTYSAMSKLISERKAIAAAAGVTTQELSGSKSWTDTLKIIENKTGNAAQAEANKYIADNPKWLDSGDKGKTLTELKSLVNERKAQAQAAGIDPGKYSTWAEIRAAMAAPPTT
ncbi:MAG: class B sortase, partial [Angelakisella sp.]